MSLLHVLVEQELDVKRLAAQATRKRLLVTADVRLQLVVAGEGGATDETAVGLRQAQVLHLHVQVPLRL